MSGTAEPHIFIYELSSTDPLSLHRMLARAACRSVPAIARGLSSTAAAAGRNGLKVPNIGIAGATGAVGIAMRQCLEARNFPFNDCKMWAHPDELGDEVELAGRTFHCEALSEDAFDDVDIALFSCGDDISEHFAPIAASKGCVVVDNSATFRMNGDTPLVVPEVNGHAAADHNGIIANPNCTTILMNVAVFPLHQARVSAFIHFSVHYLGWGLKQDLHLRYNRPLASTAPWSRRTRPRPAPASTP